MLAKVTTATIAGLTAEAVTTEVDISHGQTHFTLVGLPDPSVKEAEERVRSAIRNSRRSPKSTCSHGRSSSAARSRFA